MSVTNNKPKNLDLIEPFELDDKSTDSEDNSADVFACACREVEGEFEKRERVRGGENDMIYKGKRFNNQEQHTI